MKLKSLVILITSVICIYGESFESNYRRQTQHYHRRRSLTDASSGSGVRVPVNIEWLTDEQLSELNTVEDVVSRMEKVRSFYDQLPASELKKSATKKIVAQCYNWLPDVASEQERKELHQLHHSNHNECKEKVSEYMSRLSEDKQQEMRKYWPFCEHVWYSSHDEFHDHHPSHDNEHHDHHHHRRRRDHHTNHTLDEYFKTHLSWLDDDQKAHLKGMKGEGKSRTELQQKILEYYEAATGEVKEKASELLKGGCRQLLKSIVGEEKVNEIKTMKESGASVTELGNKVDEFFAQVEDEGKKGIIKEYGPACRKIFGLAPKPAMGRVRKDIATQSLDDYFKTHLSWLNEDQKEELKTMKTGGKSRIEIQQKMLEFYEAATGEVKEKATELLKAGCRQIIKSVFSEEKTNELKSLKESGASATELSNKVDELFATVEDEPKKAIIREFGPGCKRIFGVAKAPSRRRRDHHANPTLEDYFKTHLSWLNDEQKGVLREMKTGGKSRSDIQQKVLEFYEEATGEIKEKAGELLKGGCRQLLKSIVGEEKANELKSLKEGGATPVELGNKVDELLSTVEEESKKAIIKEFGVGCKKVFGVPVAPAMRRRRDHHANPTLDDYFKTHLSWLNDEQKEELKALKASGGSRTEIQQKVLEFYEGATGEIKDSATELLKGGCRQLLKSIVGDEKANELKSLKEGGATPAELGNKVDELFSTVEDESKKAIIKEFGPACKKIFGVAPAPVLRRRREESGVDDLESNLNTHYKWLTDEQKKELRDHKEEGGSDSTAHNKVLGFFQDLPEDVKTTARDLLVSGCEKVLERLLGEEKAEEIRNIRNEGGDVKGKISEYANDIEDESQKTEALNYAETCQQVFGSLVRRRRRLPGPKPMPNLDDYFHSNLIWLNKEEKEELRDALAEGKGRSALQKRIRQFYNHHPNFEAQDQLRAGCREVLFTVLGNQRVEELWEMYERDASTSELQTKVLELLDEVEMEEGRYQVLQFGPSCRKLFGIAQRG